MDSRLESLEEVMQYCDTAGRRRLFYREGVTSEEVRIPDECIRRCISMISAEMELYMAVCDNNVSLVETLIAKNHNPNTVFRMRVYETDMIRRNHMEEIYDGIGEGYSQFPLHRAVLLQPSNPDLIQILLQNGSDPNSKDGEGHTALYRFFECRRQDYGWRFASDSPDYLIAESLLKGTTVGLDGDDGRFLFNLLADDLGSEEECAWSFLEQLFSAGLDVKDWMFQECYYCDDDEEYQNFYQIVQHCHKPDDKGTRGFGVLEHCLKIGTEPEQNTIGAEPLILQNGLILALNESRVSPTTVFILIRTGVDLNFQFPENNFTPVNFILNKITKRLNRYSDRAYLDEKQSAGFDARLTTLWLLITAGSEPSADFTRCLIEIESSLMLSHARTCCYVESESCTWSKRRRSAVLGHLQRSFDILQEMQCPRSLFELSCIAARRAVGSERQHAVEQLKLPLHITEILTRYHDCQAIANGFSRHEWTRDARGGRTSPGSHSSCSSGEE